MPDEADEVEETNDNTPKGSSSKKKETTSKFPVWELVEATKIEDNFTGKPHRIVAGAAVHSGWSNDDLVTHDQMKKAVKDFLDAEAFANG